MIDFFLRFQKSKKAFSPSTNDFGSEWEKNSTDRKVRLRFRIFCFAILIAFITIFIRCIYRLPEMAGGWGNPLMRKENEFLLLDGMYVINASHVGSSADELQDDWHGVHVNDSLPPRLFLPPDEEVQEMSSF